MKKTIASIALAATVLVGLAPVAPAQAAESQRVSSEHIDLLSGRSQLFSTDSALERVAVSNPKVAQVRVVSNKQILVQGLMPGSATLLVWTKQGGAKSYEVTVGLDAYQVQRQIRAITGNDDIKVNFNGSSFLLSGMAATASQKEMAEKIVTSYGQPVVNLVQMANRREQIAIDVHVVELAKSAVLNLGVLAGGGEVTGFQNGVRQYIFKPGDLMMGETTPGSAFQRPIGFGQIDFLALKIDALQRRGDARLLAKPTLVTTDGGTAKFLAGGEIPIPIQQALGTTTIMWKEFGIRLEIQPTIQTTGRIALNVKPEVSSLDFANGLKTASFTVPALKSRRAETQVMLSPDETLLLGGLMSNEHNRVWDGIPFIADIPILGELVRSRRFQDNQTELAIFVTPRLVTGGPEMRAPGHLPEVHQDLNNELQRK